LRKTGGRSPLFASHFSFSKKKSPRGTNPPRNRTRIMDNLNSINSNNLCFQPLFFGALINASITNETFIYARTW
jgi:hypothetical protein